MPRPRAICIGCCVSEPRAERRVVTALKTVDVEPAVVTWNEIIEDASVSAGWAAMIYDLTPRDGRTSEVIRRFREQSLGGPFLIYAPAAPDVGYHLEEHTGRPGVLVRLQCSDPPEVARLCGDIGRLLAMFPAEQLITMLRRALPQMPRMFIGSVEEAVGLLGAGGDGDSVSASMVAEAMGVSVRTLERVTCDSELPKPKELLGWVTLLYVTLIARSEGKSPAAVARRLGLREKALYRLRRRLLDWEALARWRSDPAAGARLFDLVFLAFVERCRASWDPTRDTGGEGLESWALASAAAGHVCRPQWEGVAP